MTEDDLNYKQVLKEQFFKNDKKMFSKKSKFISYTTKDTTQILSNIASKGRFSQIRKRYKITLFLSKILLQSQFNWVLYAFTKKEILYIATANHIGQSELNLQKLNMLKYLKQSKDYENIEKINIFRDDKKVKKELPKKRILNFKEQSYGIFENHLTNKKLYDITQRIKDKINNINKLKSNY